MVKGTIPYSVVDNSSEEDKEKLLKDYLVIADDKLQRFGVIKKGK